MISKAELESVLRETLEDRKLSREERHDLKALIGSAPLGDDERAFLRNRVFAIAKEAGSTVPTDALLDWAQDTMKALESAHARTSQMEVCFSPGDECLSAIIRLLRWSKTTADICVFTITDNRVAEAIEACAARGVRVRIITDNDKSGDTGSDVQRLKKAGLSVRMDRSEHHMHHKFAVFDSSKVLTGSYNWTRSAATSNRENVLITEDLRAVGSFSEEFERLWKTFA